MSFINIFRNPDVPLLPLSIIAPPAGPPHLRSEGLPEARQAAGGEGSAWYAAHHHRQTTLTAAIGLERHLLTEPTAGQVGFVPGAVD